MFGSFFVGYSHRARRDCPPGWGPGPHRAGTGPWEQAQVRATAALQRCAGARWQPTRGSKGTRRPSSPVSPLGLQGWADLLEAFHMASPNGHRSQGPAGEHSPRGDGGGGGLPPSRPPKLPPPCGWPPSSGPPQGFWLWDWAWPSPLPFLPCPPPGPADQRRRQRRRAPGRAMRPAAARARARRPRRPRPRCPPAIAAPPPPPPCWRGCAAALVTVRRGLCSLQMRRHPLRPGGAGWGTMVFTAGLWAGSWREEGGT
jgi:hypothetical protein